MERKRVNSSKLRAVGYDEKNQILEIEMANGQVWQYTKVSSEIYRRLMASPSPTSFYEDRIIEDYSGKRA